MGYKRYFIAAIFFLCESCFAQVPSRETQTPLAEDATSAIRLADATPVALRTKENLSSASAKVGDRVPFRVVENVKVGDLIVISRGAEASGLVTAVQPKARRGRAGSLDVAIQSVQLLTGETVTLRAEEHSKGISRTGEMALGMAQLAVGSYGLALPVLPLFLLEKGGDAYLPAGSRVNAYVDMDTALDRVSFERLQPAVAARTGPATVTIFRDAYGYGTGYRPSVFCGELALARLRGSSYMKIQLPPGNYAFRSNDDQVVDVRLEEGQEIYLRTQMVPHGLSMKGHLAQVSNGEGEDEVASLHELSDKDVTKVSEANLAKLQATPEEK